MDLLRLLAGDSRDAGPPLSGDERNTLATLMRGVVEHGTGSGVPPPTHAWFVAYRGDLSLAVLVENGSSGAARFFHAHGSG